MGRKRNGGFTIVEVTVAIVVIASVSIAMFTLFSALVNSTVVAKRRAVALTLATNKIEYLKSLPYDSLAVSGGNIYATNLLPSTYTQTIDGVKYTTKISISYTDDAYDGCGSYPTLALKQAYCRNYSSSTPTQTDTNPGDYKTAHVTVTDRNFKKLASLDTQITAKVAESASTTGALFVTVIDGSGSPISGANVNILNSVVSPSVNANDTTDSNGISIFYDFPPDNYNNYVVSATKSGYSSLSTIASLGSYQPYYPNQKIITQQSSSVTLKLYPMTNNSLLVETVGTDGSPIANVKVALKGGYKKYTDASNTNYYYNNSSPDTRPNTDSNGLVSITGLSPGDEGYYFCGDDGYGSVVTERCGNYYLVSALPYGGTSPLGPVRVPIYVSGSPFDYEYNGANYIQKVRLILTTNPALPRIFSIDPSQVDLSEASDDGSLNAVAITITGFNLLDASLALSQGSTTYTSSNCTKLSQQLTCKFDLSTATSGILQISVTNSAGTVTLPTTPLGGLNVLP